MNAATLEDCERWARWALRDLGEDDAHPTKVRLEGRCATLFLGPEPSRRLAEAPAVIVGPLDPVRTLLANVCWHVALALGAEVVTQTWGVVDGVHAHVVVV